LWRYLLETFFRLLSFGTCSQPAGPVVTRDADFSPRGGIIWNRGRRKKSGEHLPQFEGLAKEPEMTSMTSFLRQL
jgi:hypothetical protein